MRRLLLLVAAAAIAALPVIADAKAKKAPTDPNEPGRRLVSKMVSNLGFPFLQTAPAPAKKAMHRKHKRHSMMKRHGKGKKK